MVDPDEISSEGLDGIPTPDILRIKFGDVNVPLLKFNTIEQEMGTMQEWGSTYWMMTFLTPLCMRRPFPRMTPLAPTPTMDLLEPTY
ncbi:MAG: hypothetical protein CL912_15320 [Deltaproteobacteria bacterium]|nr:hypothetical protein [Deltaproteobacteria bacterium]